MESVSPPPSCLSFETGSDWSPVTGESGSGAGEKFSAFIARALTSDNLVVLTGSGSSMCVVDDDSGEPIAPTMDDLWNAAANFSSFNDVLSATRYDVDSEGRNIETLLSRCHLAQSFQAIPLLDEFSSFAEGVVVERCGFVNSTVSLSHHEAFIRAISRRQPRKPRPKIFTVNYDLCFEYAASAVGAVAIDGFSHTPPYYFDGDHYSYDIVRRDGEKEAPDYIPNVLHLYKLHGSIDWRQQGSQVIRSKSAGSPLLIFPRSTKFETSYKQPFLEMFSRFQIALRQRNTALIVIGFGFRDAHIVEPLMSAVRSNASLQVLIVDTTFREHESTPLGQLFRMARDGDRRLWFLKSEFSAFVPLLPDLVGVSESERHLQRVRQALENP